jgi:hypothetical protein
MTKAQNKELARAEYACRTMRNSIKEKDRELEDAHEVITELRSDLRKEVAYYEDRLCARSIIMAGMLVGVFTSSGVAYYAC